MMRNLTAMAALASLAACTTTDTRMVDSRTAMVTTNTHTFADSWTVASAGMREAAQQTIDNDFTHFQIIDATDYVKEIAARNRPPISPVNTCAADSGCRMAGGSRTATTPDAVLVVRFLTAVEADGAENVWNAQEVLTSYR